MVIRTKEVIDGICYMRTVTRNDADVVVTDELCKADPVLSVTLPDPVAAGETVVVPFVLADFDGERRSDSGVVCLDIGGTVFEFDMIDGGMSVTLELHDDVRVSLADPRPMDMRMMPFVLEVAL